MDKADRRELDRKVGARLKVGRELRKLKLEVLAREMDLTHQAVQKYEAGETRMTAGALYDVARILDLPLSFFFRNGDSFWEVEERNGRASRLTLYKPAEITIHIKEETDWQFSELTL